MRKIILSIVVIAAISFPANRIMAQATVTTAGAANIVTPIALEETSSLSFGTMSVLSRTPDSNSWCEPFECYSYKQECSL